MQQITVICAALEREAEAVLVHQSYRWDSDKLSIGLSAVRSKAEPNVFHLCHACPEL